MSKNSKTAIILSVYLGPLPRWFSFYLRSVAFNPLIDFALFSDQPPPSLPANVKWFACSIEAVKKTIEDRLGAEWRAKSAYKLCDVRPMYAVLFPEVVSEYCYWAWSDIDVVFGDIEKNILREGVSGDYDIISSHPLRINGPLTFCKNSETINRLYLKSPRYLEAISGEDHIGFDEGPISVTVREDKSIRALYRPSHRHNYSPGRFYWEKGKVVEEKGKQETGFFHFRTWKDQMGDAQGDKIYFTPKGFKPSPLSFIDKLRLFRRPSRVEWQPL